MLKKICKTCEKEFVIKDEDLSFYEQIKSPTPNYCPECRMKRRMIWRNERTLHHRTCDLCKKNIITIYSPDIPYKVYCNDCFHSDNWDSLSYGMDLDFSKPFLQQFKELQLKTPHLYAFVFKNVNSEYVNGAAFNKNCYLIFVSDHNEDCMYSHSIFDSKNTLDCLNSNECEFCYDCVTCKKCYRVLFSEDCSSSQDLYFCKNCANCHDCIASTNLRNQQFCIKNIQYTKEEYMKEKERLGLSIHRNILEIQKQAKELRTNYPLKYIHGVNNVKVTGDYIFNSKNTKQSYDSELLEDCSYMNFGNKVKSCYDGYVVVDNSELSHENVSVISLNNVHYSYCTYNCFDSEFTDFCENSNNLFSCVSLKKKQYCILNKQYIKEEYEELVPKIKQHIQDMPYQEKDGQSFIYGDFFPTEFSPFGYNETAAQEYFPLSREKAIENGYQWREKDERNYNINIKGEDLLEDVTDVDDGILEKVIGCMHYDKNDHGDINCSIACTSAFKILPDELSFYHRMNLPLPRLCPNCRHYNRLEQKNPLKLISRMCQCSGEKSENGLYKNTAKHAHDTNPCENEFETTYSIESTDIVYCEKCYQQEIF